MSSPKSFVGDQVDKIPASAKRRVGSVHKALFVTDPPALCGGKSVAGMTLFGVN